MQVTEFFLKQDLEGIDPIIFQESLKEAIKNQNKMERQKVYEAIDSERKYQIDMTADPNHLEMIEFFNMGDTISAIEYNLNLAKEMWYNSPPPYQHAMNCLRKIAGLCVQVGEKYGMPNR